MQVVAICVSFPMHQESPNLELRGLRNDQITLDWSKTCFSFDHRKCTSVFRPFDYENHRTGLQCLHTKCRSISWLQNGIRITSIRSLSLKVLPKYHKVSKLWNSFSLELDCISSLALHILFLSLQNIINHPILFSIYFLWWLNS